jgi:hypothetical protein
MGSKLLVRECASQRVDGPEEGPRKRGFMRRFLISAAVATSAAMLIAAPAYPAKKASISVSPTSVPAGGTVHISGSIPVTRCPASDGATVTGESGLFPPDGFGPTATRDSNGDFALDYTVPTSTPAGTYDVGLRCGGANVGVAASLTVSAVPLGGPETGAGGTAHGSVFWTTFGVSCLVLAGIAVIVRQRVARRSR